MNERRAALGGAVPRRVVARAARSRRRWTTSFDEFYKGTERPQGVDDDGVREDAGEAAARQGNRQAGRADRAGRGAHVRHGVALPRRRHLLEHRPALRAGRHGHAAVLQGSEGRPDSRRGHHRGGIDLVVHRRRHGLRHARRQHDSVLHLLFDVRLPARRRLHLGRGRRALPRLPARRHGRPDDAGRRRAAAPGRQQPHARADACRPAAPTIRRTRTSSATIIEDGIKRMYGDGEAGVLLPDRHERAVRDAGDARGRARRHHQGAVSLQDRRRRRRRARARSSSAAARSSTRSSRRRRLLEKYGVAADVWSATSYNELYRDAHRVERWNLLHPTETAARAVRHRVPRRRRRASSSRRPTT